MLVLISIYHNLQEIDWEEVQNVLAEALQASMGQEPPVTIADESTPLAAKNEPSNGHDQKSA